jgi:DNA-binding protein YbaB
MSISGHDLINEATQELRRQQEQLQKARDKLENTTTKVRSKDGMVTVVLDARGQLASIAFNTQKFRRMAPAELGSILVETIVRAQAESRERVLSAFKDFIPKGLEFTGGIAAKPDLNKMFDEAVRQSEELLAEQEVRFSRNRQAANGHSANGNSANGHSANGNSANGNSANGNSAP